MKTISQMEYDLIVERLEYYEGNKTQTALSLGITIKTLYNKLHQFGLFEQYKAGAVQKKTFKATDAKISIGEHDIEPFNGDIAIGEYGDPGSGEYF